MMSERDSVEGSREEEEGLKGHTVERGPGGLTTNYGPINESGDVLVRNRFSDN